MNVVNPNDHKYKNNTLLETILKLILSNIKGTLEHHEKEMNKHKKY